MLEGAMQKPLFQDLQSTAEELPLGSVKECRMLEPAT